MNQNKAYSPNYLLNNIPPLIKHQINLNTKNYMIKELKLINSYIIKKFIILYKPPNLTHRFSHL